MTFIFPFCKKENNKKIKTKKKRKITKRNKEYGDGSHEVNMRGLGCHLP